MSFHVYLNKPQGLWRKEDMAIYTNTNPHFLRYVKRAAVRSGATLEGADK